MEIDLSTLHHIPCIMHLITAYVGRAAFRSLDFRDALLLYADQEELQTNHCMSVDPWSTRVAYTKSTCHPYPTNKTCFFIYCIKTRTHNKIFTSTFQKRPHFHIRWLLQKSPQFLIRWHPSGKYIALASSTCVRIWYVSEEGQVVRCKNTFTFDGKPGIEYVDWHPTDIQIFIRYQQYKHDTIMETYDIDTHTNSVVFVQHMSLGEIVDFAFSPSTTWNARLENDKGCWQINMYQTNTNKQLFGWYTLNFSEFRTMRWNSDETKFAYYWKTRIVVWDMITPVPYSCTYEWHGPVEHLEWSFFDPAIVAIVFPVDEMAQKEQNKHVDMQVCLCLYDDPTKNKKSTLDLSIGPASTPSLTLLQHILPVSTKPGRSQLFWHPFRAWLAFAPGTDVVYLWDTTNAQTVALHVPPYLITDIHWDSHGQQLWMENQFYAVK